MPRHFHGELFCFSFHCCFSSPFSFVIKQVPSVIHNSPRLKLEREFLSRRITFISINESLSFIPAAKCTLPFIHYDMLNPGTSASAKNIISPLCTHFLQRRKHVCSLTSAPTNVSALSVPATWLQGLGLLRLQGQISRDNLHSTQNLWILTSFFRPTSRNERLFHQIPVPPSCSYLFVLCIFSATR